MKKMDMSKISSEDLVKMFEQAFEEQVSEPNSLGECGIDCDDRSLGKPVRVTVDVSGLAGTPTIDQFRAGKVKGSNTVIISRDDIGELKFNLLPNMTVFLSGNDYQLVYESK